MIKVKILNYTKDGEETIATAGKLCYAPTTIEGIQEKLTDEEKEKFIKKLVDLGHYSPLEHASVTFGVEGVSRALTHQLVRHRIASYSQQSQRYVKLDQFEYVIPKEIEKNKEAKEIFIKAMEQDQKVYDELVEILKREGRNEKEAIEDARYVFPNACETKIIFTMNIRTLLEFIKKRSCNRAQTEIHEMTDLMIEELKEIYPILFKEAGPPCVRGGCPEGKMTCGKISEVREKYRD